MKHNLSLGLILFIALLLVIQVDLVNSKKKKSSKKSKKTSKSKPKAASSFSLPMNFKINQDSYIAASILKTLGAKVNLESLIVKFQRNCKGLKMVKSINNSIKTIISLTRKSDKKGFKIAKKQIKSILGKRKKSKLFGRNIFGGAGLFGGSGIKNSFDSFKSRVSKGSVGKKGGSKKRKGKLSKLKKICEAKGFYNAAVSKLKGTKAKLKQLKKKKLVRVIKRTIRRLLARILGCDFVRNGKLSKVIRKTVRRITTRKIKTNVFKLANMFKRISKNYRRRPRTVKRTRKIMRRIFAKLVRGGKVKPATIMLVKKLAINNCRAADICYKKNVFSKKCFEVSKMCLNMKSIVRKIRANKVGVVVSSLIKNLFKNN